MKKKLLLCQLFSFVYCFVSFTQVNALSIDKIQTKIYPESIVIVVSTDILTSYQRVPQTSPEKIIIQFSDASLQIPTKPIEVDDGTIRTISWKENPSQRTIQLSIELEVFQPYMIYTKNNPSSLVVHIKKQISNQPAPMLRIGLLLEEKMVSFSATNSFAIFDQASKKILVTGARNEIWSVGFSAGKYDIIDSKGKLFGRYTGPLTIKTLSPEKEFLLAKDTLYRGEFEIKSFSQNTVTLINKVDIEYYLYGVVSREMPSSWGQSALQAQAIAARTYALRHQKQYPEKGFDLLDSVMDQVYGGKSAEIKSTTKAVNITRGITATYQGNYIKALYFSTAGGFTEDNDKIFSDQPPLPYLRATKTKWDDSSPHLQWKLSLKRRVIEKKINAHPEIDIGTLSSIELKETGDSGRWLFVTLTGSKETKTIKANEFRALLGPGSLKSTRFQMTENGDRYDFEGSGFGHGVGMCQYSAKGMAKAGYSFRQILRKFYTDQTRLRVEY